MKNIIEQIVDDATIELEEDIITEEGGLPNISCLDPEWINYVLDQLTDRELMNGAPTTDGLRRVTECIFGEILQSDTEIIKVEDHKVTAKHTLVISKYNNGSQIVVSACVDVLKDKLIAPFNSHLASTACTRAEGKALRRALKIRVQTAEELTNVASEEDKTDKDNINDQQIIGLQTMCKRNDIDVIKFINQNIMEKRKIKKITQLNKLEARIMMEKLSGYQRSKDDIPKNIIGYDTNWQEKLGDK